VDHALQVVRISDIGVIRVKLDKAVDRLVGGGRFAVFPVAIRDVDLRLLGEMAEWVATLERFEILRAFAPVAAAQGVLRLVI